MFEPDQQKNVESGGHCIEKWEYKDLGTIVLNWWVAIGWLVVFKKWWRRKERGWNEWNEK
jgi:hypothetical protein